MERDVSTLVKKSGGTVVGGVKHPINTNDFSSFLLQAQASKAQIIGLANAGGDTINSIKQAAEFGIVKGGQKFAGLLVFASDVAGWGFVPVGDVWRTFADLAEQGFAVIEQEAARGRDRFDADAVALRQFAEVVVPDHLQVEEAGKQRAEQHHDDERGGDDAPAEHALFGVMILEPGVAGHRAPAVRKSGA